MAVPAVVISPLHHRLNLLVLDLYQALDSLGKSGRHIREQFIDCPACVFDKHSFLRWLGVKRYPPGLNHKRAAGNIASRETYKTFWFRPLRAL